MDKETTIQWITQRIIDEQRKQCKQMRNQRMVFVNTGRPLALIFDDIEHYIIYCDLLEVSNENN